MPSDESGLPKDAGVASADDLATNDAAELLYYHGIGAIGVSFIAAAFLFLVCLRQLPHRPLLIWGSLMFAVLLLRALDVLHWHRDRLVRPRSGKREIRRFGTGLMFAATLWGAFPVAFFSALNQSGRATAAIILSGMAGGSATVLAPSQGLSLMFCSVVIWPMAVSFLLLNDFEGRLLGALGCVYFVVMAVSSRLAHKAAMTAVRLSRANEALLSAVMQQRERTETVNTELKATQSALREANQSLEFRIKVRTADLRREIGEKERYARELARLASTDPLTGLANRAKLVSDLKDKLSLPKAAQQKLAVLFIDLDKFKEVNDVMGHCAGDRVLQIAAQRLAYTAPRGVYLARWGGDEFVAIMPEVGHSDAAMQLGSALRAVLSKPIQLDDDLVNIDATVGVALFPDHGSSDDELIRAADVAMYAEKETKGSKVRLFDPDLSDRLIERHLLEQALRDAIPSGAFSLVFEPIVSARTGECQAMEALLRWKHPTRGWLPPSNFIQLAERTGDIAAIGRWVLREACRHAVSWQCAVPPAVSVNVSAAQLLSENFVSDVMCALSDTGLPGERLQIELTESVFAGDHAAANAVLSELREFGVHVSLDDFGTGFSSLSYLQNLAIDSVKIDRSFIETIDTDSAPIVRAILTLVHSLGFEAIAEGVETTAQAEAAINMGVNYLQGYFLTKSLDARETADWLESESGSLLLRIRSLQPFFASSAGAA